MHATQVCHKIMNNALDWMHTLRREALNSCVLAVINGRRLSVTGLGRAIRSRAKEKHCIKRADRLLSNPHLHREQGDIYHAMSRIIVKSGDSLLNSKSAFGGGFNWSTQHMH